MRVPDAARSRAVVIGTATYLNDELPDVPAVARNVEDLARTLTSPPQPMLDPSNCTTVLDVGDPAVLGRALLAAARAAEDLLLIYYAGHGLLSPRRHELYLSLPGTDPDALGFTAVHIEVIRDAIRDSPADNRVLILDCCYSGRAINGALAARVAQVLGQLAVNGTYTITAAPANRTAVVLPGESNTAFTGRLLRLLRSGPMSLGEIYRRLRSNMAAEGLPVPEHCGTGTADQLVIVSSQQGSNASEGPTTSDRSDHMSAEIVAGLRERADTCLRYAFTSIDRACDHVREVVEKGGTLLFVGTADDAKKVTAAEASRVGMPYVSHRWLGGMLTNFSTVLKRLQRLEELDSLGRPSVGRYEPALQRERDKLSQTLGGLRGLRRPPEAVWIADPRKDHIALEEAAKLGITVIAMVDSEDTEHVSFPILRDHELLYSPELVTYLLAEAAAAGLAAREPESTEAAFLEALSALPEPQVGDVFVGTVARMAAFGAFVSLARGVEGLLHSSKLVQTAAVLTVGDTVEVRVAHIDRRGQPYLDLVDFESRDG
jgi:ribosomal protein S2